MRYGPLDPRRPVGPAFLPIGHLGRFFDRSSSLHAWTLVRTGWMVLLNGVMRLSASAVAAVLIGSLPRATVIAIGGIGVLLAALHSWRPALTDSTEAGCRDIAGFEEYIERHGNHATNDR